MRKNVRHVYLPNKSLLKNVQNVRISCKNFMPKFKHFMPKFQAVQALGLPVKSGLHSRMCPQI